MPVPDAVKKQAEKAENLFDQEYGKGKTDEKEAAPEEKKLEVAEEVVEKKVDEEAISTIEARNKELMEELRKKEDSFNVLQGKYNAEVPRLHEELGELKESIASTVSEKADKAVASDLEESYGPEFVVSLEKLLDSKLESKLKAHIKPMQTKLKTITDRTIRSEKEHFFDTLSSLVPDWRTLKEDDGFKSFLSEFDSFSGKRRHDLALDAQESFDANRVASFYVAYKDSGKAKGEAPKKTREGLIVPSGSNKGSTGSSEVKTVSVDEIKRFYNDLTHNKFVGTKEDAEKIRVEIDRAVAEGRVIT